MLGGQVRAKVHPEENALYIRHKKYYKIKYLTSGRITPFLVLNTIELQITRLLIFDNV